MAASASHGLSGDHVSSAAPAPVPRPTSELLDDPYVPSPAIWIITLPFWTRLNDADIHSLCKSCTTYDRFLRPLDEVSFFSATVGAAGDEVGAARVITTGAEVPALRKMILQSMTVYAEVLATVEGRATATAMPSYGTLQSLLTHPARMKVQCKNVDSRKPSEGRQERTSGRRK